MRLVAFRVNKFRNIIDSEEVAVESDVTGLVGKNEGGKTAALNALYRLNAAYGEEFEVSEHYPRWLLTADRKAGTIGDADTITGKFELEDDDVAAVEEQFGKDVLKDKAFSYTRGYEGRRANVQLDEAVALTNFLATSAATQATKDLFKSNTTMEALRTAVAAKLGDEEVDADSVADIQVLQQEITELIGEETTLWQTVVSLLKKRMPKFFYFSQYSLLPGRIDLQTIDEEADGPGASALQTARALLGLAGTTTESLPKMIMRSAQPSLRPFLTI